MENIVIRDIDEVEIIVKLTELYEHLREITIPINTHRKNTSGVGRTATLGSVKRYDIQEVVDGRLNKYDHIFNLVHDIGDYYGIDYTTVQVNHNYKTDPHYDKMNLSGNTLISFGDYDGGYLYIDGQKIDTYLRMVKFDGSQLKHWNDENSGHKYSLIFYKSKDVMSLLQKNKPFNQILQELE